MAHNSKKNARYTTNQDGDDYVYPTKKVRENKTRNRRSDSDLINAGLMDHEHGEEGSLEEEIAEDDREALEDYNDMIKDFNDACDEDEADRYDSLHDDLMGDYGYEFEEDY